MAGPTSIRGVMGDFNAELDPKRDSHLVGASVLGPFGDGRVTTARQEWRSWAEREQFVHCHSRYHQGQPWTWQHPRFHSRQATLADPTQTRSLTFKKCAGLLAPQFPFARHGRPMWMRKSNGSNNSTPTQPRPINGTKCVAYVGTQRYKSVV